MTLHFQIDWKDALAVNQNKIAPTKKPKINILELKKKKEQQCEVLTAFFTRAPRNLRIENTSIFL